MSPRLTRTAGRWLVLLGLLVACGCSPAREEQPEPQRSHRPPLNTIAAGEVGDRLILTASVTGTPQGRAFVVRDVDLPDQGLLVLGAADVGPLDLVTVAGTIELFAFAEFRDRYELGDPTAFRPFEGRKVLVAHDVRSWAKPDAADDPAAGTAGAPMLVLESGIAAADGIFRPTGAGVSSPGTAGAVAAVRRGPA